MPLNNGEVVTEIVVSKECALLGWYQDRGGLGDIGACGAQSKECKTQDAGDLGRPTTDVAVLAAIKNLSKNVEERPKKWC